MTPERWQQIEHLLHTALEREPGERAALLERECAGDADLRAEVESLIASAEPAQSFLKGNAPEDATMLLEKADSNSLIGQQIGPYFIQKQLGSGGMGEVYLARDVRLGRNVALKLVDPGRTRDEATHMRFLREARLASALDHPNICTVHEVGEAAGHLFITMQYVVGETLREVINGRPLGLDSLLSIGLQTADAISAAHAQGIIHRDIKPGNIIVTPRGQAKVLDFGLAKLLEGEEGEAATHLTITGAVMGTPAAMSPEQARGEHVDHRSDIFSFGVVLFEMATGQLPFKGRSTADVISALLNEQQTPAAEINKDVPARLSSAIDRALAKDPGERYQSMPEMIAELRQVVSESGGLDRLFSSSDIPRGGVPLVPPQRSRLRAAVGRPAQRHVTKARLAAAVALIVALTAFGIWLYRSVVRRDSDHAAQTPMASAPFQTMRITRLTTVGTASAATVSPDGRYIAYATGEAVSVGGWPLLRWPAGRASLWVKQLSTNRAVEIIPPADVQYRGTTFSPDGELVYYVAIDQANPMGSLYRVPVLGGPPRKILTHIACPISFSPDGKQLAFVRNYPTEGGDALVVAAIDGSGERTLTVRKGNDWLEEDGLSWSPDGQTIACVVGTDTGGTSMTVFSVPVAGGEMKAITTHRWVGGFGRVVWLSDSSGLIVIGMEARSEGTAGTDGQIWFSAYPDGAVRRITNDLNGYSHSSLGLTFDSRALVAVQEDTSARMWLATLDSSFGVSTDAVRQLTGGKFDGRHGLSWTPDGQVVYVTRIGEAEDVWIMNGDGTDPEQLTDDAAFDEMPVASPDGRYIYFASTRTGIRQIWRMDMDGTHAQQLTEGASIDFEPNCSPDGKWIAFSSWRSGKNAIWKMPADGGEAVQLTGNPAARPVFSPDGKFISCLYFDEQKPSAQWRLAIIPAEGGRPIKIFDLPYETINALAGIWWTPDSRALIYIDTRHGVSNVWRKSLDDRAPQQLTHFDSGQIFNLALTGDGRRLALARGTVSSDVVMISNVK